MNGAIKPELVDFAGDMRFERGRIRVNPPIYAGVPTTAKNFAPPNGTLFRTVTGTSFAAPRVANLAARLFKEFPNASSNLVRALIADSARIPQNRPTYLLNKKSWEDEILRLYGYGQPDFTRARWSYQNEVLLIADTSIELGWFQLFTIPPLPEDFIKTTGGQISVTLAFDPPTRYTRGDSYLGVVMEFILFRNVTAANIAEALRVLKPEERENLENEELPTLRNLRGEEGLRFNFDMKPTSQRRKKGTLQRAIFRVPKSNWQYNGGELVLAVICHRKWAPANITHQRFAIVASLNHDDPMIDIYSHVQQHVRAYQRVRVTV